MITNPEDWRVATCESSRSHRSERELEAMGNLSKQGPDAENQAPSWTPQSCRENALTFLIKTEPLGFCANTSLTHQRP